MKKIIISIVIAFICIAANAQKNIIKTNPFGMAFGNINLIYERLLNNHSSILVKGQYGYNLLGTSVNLFGCGVDYRYYFTYAKKAVPSGFYINPEILFQGGAINTIDVQDNKSGLYRLGLGAEIGYQWVWDSGFTLDLGIGPMYNLIKTDSGNFEKLDFLLPAGTLGIGFAF